ncbi:MAG: homocitrate synthase [Syntrophaceae bacterium CG2_30_49_12]|nr:MAG: homocitrate synthase [Syntrophaceae bacterium CG2_30_49_12]PIU23946.1 MAG: homocitrate synthase [Chloroflexi bacterium CG08_land_8_20_14_0_20_45_12]PIX27281.1 MAG: homocitrate synthase [Chloroflexi bacterium CG_4_8_14_3_um_filter_45_15]PJB48251.1 MAG: homocitrate synthase [Chloroflexi bacterium CG_4_9_14_3_um_filter_45_9]
MPGIYFIDVTNRDGVQTAHLGLSKLEKTMINLYLNEMGVFQSEFGFPTTRHEQFYLQANLELAETGVLQPIRLSGWVRATTSDVATAFKFVPGIKHLNLSISTSEQMINGKFLGKKTKEDILKTMVDAVEAARAYGAESIGVNAEDASRTDIDFLVRFALAAKEHGADRFRYCDTLGYDNSFTIYEAVKILAENGGMPIEIHCHSDLGMAVANSLAGAKGAIDGGQDVYINTTVNGMGERAGNADLVATVLAVTKSKGFAERYKLVKPIDLTRAWKIAKFASYAFGVPIPVNQPGMGANAFAHASGIHADGVLKDPQNYELYNYTELGRGEPELVETGREICSGEYSGISGFRHIMGKMAVTFADAKEAEMILELVRYANVEAQKPLVEEELLFITKYPKIAKKLLTLKPLE